MLVEDDANLRAIYGDRLLAEGYEIVSAKDGEEGLAMAVKEKPDLIISDVMMPKISGFDMLDILRTTPETKDTKVIMMTALSQGEDKERADKLGADKYLVKSQVTLEDVARVVHEVLGDTTENSIPQTPTSEPTTYPIPAAAVIATTEPTNPFTAEPVTTQPTATTQSAPATPVEPAQAQPTVQQTPFTMPPTETTIPSPVQTPLQPIVQPQPTSTPVTPLVQPAAQPVVSVTLTQTPEETVASQPEKRIIQPLTDPSATSTPRIYDLYEKEMAAQATQVNQPAATNIVQPTPVQQTPTQTPIQPISAPIVASQAVVQPPAIDPNTIAL